MTRQQLHARLTEILAGTPTLRERGRPRNSIDVVQAYELIRGVKHGEMIVISRPVAEAILRLLQPTADRSPISTPSRLPD